MARGSREARTPDIRVEPGGSLYGTVHYRLHSVWRSLAFTSGSISAHVTAPPPPPPPKKAGPGLALAPPAGRQSRRSPMGPD